MSNKTTFYSLIVAAIATAASALINASAASQMATLAAGGEGTGGEIARLVNTLNLSRASLILAGLFTVILCAQLIKLKRNASRQTS